MSKWIEKIGKKWRHRRARHEVRLKSKKWKYSNDADCGDQGAGTLGMDEVVNLEKYRRRLKRQSEAQIAAKKEEQFRLQAERRGYR